MWNKSSSKGAQDGFRMGSLYVPRPDYMVQPSNLTTVTEADVQRINDAFGNKAALFQRLRAESLLGEASDFSYNQNPRLFVAVEDEISSPTEKHRLGSVINASLLGKVGIVTGVEGEMYNSLSRIRRFLTEWAGMKKGLCLAPNVLVIEKERLIAALTS